MAELSQLKQAQRAAWAAGDYPDIAKSIEAVSVVAVEEADTGEGSEHLDVATGTGNAALAAARQGANVTGIDLTPELLTVARERAEQEGLPITFAEADAEQLPFPDASFDRVTSVFGAMFAPDQRQTAAELLRVCRPGGKVVVTAWTPDGLNGQMFGAMARHMPPPPEGFQPPVLWGTEDRMRELFTAARDVRCERRQATGSVEAESVDAWLDYLERVLGPLSLAKQALEPDGRWAPVRADLFELYERFNEAGDGSMRAAPEYLLTVANT